MREVRALAARVRDDHRAGPSRQEAEIVTAVRPDQPSGPRRQALRNSKAMRHHRDDHDSDDDQLEVLFDHRDIAEQIAGADADAHPQHRAGHVVEGKARVRHVGAAGDEGHKGADDRHEPRQHHGAPAMPFEELVRLRGRDGA